MWLVFTDLDGTLLDHETYSFEPARPALERLRRMAVPLVLTTSKTRVEVEVWRGRLDNHDPFIVENGGAVFVPRVRFGVSPDQSVPRGPYDVIEFGDRYETLVDTLASAARETSCLVKGFHEMTAEEVSAACGLTLEEAGLAKQREYDEVFEIVDTARAEALLRAVEGKGKRWTRGGRFYHITGNNDKAAAVEAVRALYQKAFGEVTTVGLGDGMNDAPFLNAVEIPILIRSDSSAELEAAVPRGRLTDQFGPAGWNQALLQVIPE
jgi:mannosyl-3-phosphoglycerate phosphatase